MKFRTRIILGIVLYVLLCISNYVANDPIEWKSNLLQSIVVMIVLWIILELYPSSNKQFYDWFHVYIYLLIIALSKF